MMTVDVNSENAVVLDLDHDDMQDSNHLVEPVADNQHNDVLPTVLTVEDSAELQVVELPPESHVTTITYLMIQQLAVWLIQWWTGCLPHLQLQK